MILLIAAFVSMVDRSVMPPLVPVVATSFGVPIGAVGTSLTVYAICYAGFQLVWSTLAARVGRVRVLTVSTALSGCANLGSALAADPLTYVLLRGLSGAAFSATITTVLIYFGDTLTMQRRAVATANLAAAIALGLTAGTAGAGVIAQWFGWRWVYGAVAIACAALTVWLVRLPESFGGTDERLRVSIRRLSGNRWAATILALTMVEGALLVGVFNYLPVALQAKGATVLVAGVVTAAFGVTVVVTSQLMKLVLGRWPSWLLLLLAGLAMTTAYTVAALQVSLGSVVAATSLVGLAWALGHTTIQTWMTDAVADSRAIGMSLFSISLFVGASIGAALGNIAASRDAFEVLFLAAAVVAAGFAAVTTAARARYRVREQPPDG